MTRCQSVTTIAKFGNGLIWYLDGDESLPYTYEAPMFYYFTHQENGDYVLAMTSTRDLQEKPQ